VGWNKEMGRRPKTAHPSSLFLTYYYFGSNLFRQLYFLLLGHDSYSDGRASSGGAAGFSWAYYRLLCPTVLILVFSCQVSGFVWFVVVLQRPGAGFVPGLVAVFVRSMG
jgi:hypothetical protein